MRNRSRVSLGLVLAILWSPGCATTKPVGAMIAEGVIREGQTYEEVRAVAGKPARIETSMLEGVPLTIWHYVEPDKVARALYPVAVIGTLGLIAVTHPDGLPGRRDQRDYVVFADGRVIARNRMPEAATLRQIQEARRTALPKDDPAERARAAEEIKTQAERKAREEAEQLAKVRAEAERAARERAAETAKARAQAQREAQARAEREAKEGASGLAGADWARRRPLAEAAVGQAAQAEARGDVAGALRAYHRGWLLVYRDEDEALRGRVEEALARLVARLAEKPAADEAARRHAVQGDAYFDARRFDDAAVAYTRLLAVAPWHAVGRYNLALALAAQERYGEAIAEMRRFLLLIPEGPTARTAQDTIYKWETQLR